MRARTALHIRQDGSKFTTMIPALLLVLAAVAYRVILGLFVQSDSSWLPNFAPFAAIALCCAVYLPKRYKFTLPLLALFVSDVILNVHYGASLLDGSIFCRYVALGLIGCVGLMLQNRPSLKNLLPAAVAGSVMFYVMTNALAWFSNPAYAKSFAGLLQALTVGMPEYSATPSWMFFRNSLVSDLFFTTVFVACMHFGRSTSRARAPQPLPTLA